MNTLTQTGSFVRTARIVRGGLAITLAWLRRRIKNWIAAAVAYRERKKTIAALSNLSDRELKDIGIHWCGIDAKVVRAAQRRMLRLQ